MAQLAPSQTENAFTLDNSCSPTTMGMSLPTPEYRKVFRQADMVRAEYPTFQFRGTQSASRGLSSMILCNLSRVLRLI